VSEQPLVTAMVLNWNGAHLLPDCLGSLAAQDWPLLETLVVDNGSIDDSRAVTARYPARFLGLGRNLGFSRAYNRALPEAKGEFLFIVNNDMRFRPQCVSRLARALAADPTLFAVDPTQLSWDGARVIHGRMRLVRGSVHDTVIPPFAAEYTAPADAPVEVPWGCAGSLLVRRGRFEALGGFDPTFFIDFEDTDLCWRAWRRGWRTEYVPEAVLYHKVGMSGDEYQHLIRGVAPGAVPKTWFRRRVSYHTNLVRFALKCLPLPVAVRLLMHVVTRAAWHLAHGNAKLALSIAVALATNVRRLPSTCTARAEVERTQVHDHAALMARFAPAVTAEGAPEAPLPMRGRS
jgi:GT2 family glycosyltransferase